MQPRGRKFNISGIFETGLEEFDKLYVLGDIGHIQKLNNWNEDEVGGFEILIDDYSKLMKWVNWFIILSDTISNQKPLSNSTTDF